MKKRFIAVLLSITMLMSGNVAVAADSVEQSPDALPVLTEDEAGGTPVSPDDPGKETSPDTPDEEAQGGKETSPEAEQESGTGKASKEAKPGNAESTNEGAGEGTEETSKKPGEDIEEGAGDNAEDGNIEDPAGESSEDASEEASEESSEELLVEESDEALYGCSLGEDLELLNPDEDPEFFKYYGESDEEPISLETAADLGLFGAGMGNADPHNFKLHDGSLYAYPKYYKTDNDEERADIRYGLDISKFQGSVSQASFEAMKNSYNIEFLFIRAGFRGYGDKGTLNEDPVFLNNVRNASAAGLRIGVYYFSQATTLAEGEAEAAHCLELIKKSGVTPNLPVIMDYEYAGDPGRLKKADLAPSTKSAIANAFCRKVRAAGYLAGIYASKSFFLSDMDYSKIDKKNYIWMAHYVNKNSDGVYTTDFDKRLEAWQFTSAFTGFGTAGTKYFGNEKADFDFWYGYFPNEIYYLNYDANGGTGEMKATSGKANEDVTVSENAFTRTGCRFREWNTEADGSGDSYDPKNAEKQQFFLDENNRTLYAIWECDVTYDDRNGSETEAVPTDADKLLTRPADPAKEGYKFTGWYMDSECSLKWNFATDKVIQDTVLYAGWELSDETFSWGDLELSENSRVKELFTSPAEIPEGFWLFDIDEAGDGKCITDMRLRDREYTGKALTFPDLKVFFGKNMLKAGKDYTIKYTTNVKVGTGKITATLKGNYSGRLILEFAITPIDITGRIAAGDISLVYNRKVQKGTTTVLYKNGTVYTQLKAGTDFTFIYPGTDKKDAENYDPTAFVGKPDEDTQYTVKIVGKGGYTGESSFTETIRANTGAWTPVSKFSVSAVKTQTLSLDKDGNVVPAKPAFTVKFGGKPVTCFEDVSEESIPEEDGYYVTYESNDRIGTAYACITGTGKYCGTRRISFKINPLPLSKATVTKPVSGMTFTGKEITQTGYELRYGVTKTFEGTPLVEGRDYTVSYANNINAGRGATIIYTGIGIYSGSVKKTYTISPVELKVAGEKNPDIDMYKDHLVTYTKGGAKPRIKLVYSHDENIYTLVPGKDYTLKYTGNNAVSAAGKNATVTIVGKGNFKGSLIRTFKVVSSDLAYTDMTATDVVYTGKAGKWKPSITLWDTNGKKLSAGSDYDKKNIVYTYKKDGEDVVATASTILDAGTEVTATVTGKGNYTGTKSATFRVVGANIAKASVKISDRLYTGRKVTITKEDIAYIRMGKEDLVYGDDYLIEPDSYVNNVNTGTAKVTIKGIGNYGGTKVVTFRIVKRKSN